MDKLKWLFMLVWGPPVAILFAVYFLFLVFPSVIYEELELRKRKKQRIEESKKLKLLTQPYIYKTIETVKNEWGGA